MVSMSRVVSAYTKADPGMSPKLARYLVLKLTGTKELKDSSMIVLRSFQRMVNASPLHRYSAFSQSEDQLRTFSPTMASRKSKEAVSLDANIQAFLDAVRSKN